MVQTKELLKAIKAKCLDCNCGSFKASNLCSVTKCSLLKFNKLLDWKNRTKEPMLK